MTTDDSSRSPSDEYHDLARVMAWEDRWAWPMFAGSLLMFAASTWLLADVSPSPWGVAVASLTIIVLWVLFIVDYLVRLRLAGSARAVFLRSRAFDLVSLVLPLLRPFLILIFLWRLPSVRYGSAAVQRTMFIVTTVTFTVLFVYTASWGVWLVERNAEGASITTFGDALFWGFTTITTVGYGDYVPVTLVGRVLAVGLMLGGIGVIGVTSATIVSALNDRIRRVAEAARRDRPPHGTGPGDA